MLNYEWKATCIRTPRTKTEAFAQLTMLQWLIQGNKVKSGEVRVGNKLTYRISNVRFYQNPLTIEQMKYENQEKPISLP